MRKVKKSNLSGFLTFSFVYREADKAIVHFDFLNADATGHVMIDKRQLEFNNLS